MTRIINAYSGENAGREGEAGVANSLKNLGESIFGNQAHNEVYRQTAAKQARENANAQPLADALARGDYEGATRYGVLADRDPKFTAGYGQYYGVNKYGPGSAQGTTATMAVPGSVYGHTVAGEREGLQNKVDIAQMQTDRALASDERKFQNTPEQVVGPDGVVRYMPRSQAMGQPAGSVASQEQRHQFEDKPIAALDASGNPVYATQGTAVSGGFKPIPTDQQQMYLLLHPPQTAAPGAAAAAPVAPPMAAGPATPSSAAPGATPDPAVVPPVTPPAAAPAQPSTSPLDQGPHGEEFLKTQPPAFAAQIRAIAKGDQPWPTVTGRGSAYNQTLLTLLNQYDPSLTAYNYEARKKQQADLATNGTAGKLLTGINQLLPHMETTSNLAEGLRNSHYPAQNAIQNWLATSTGDPRVAKFNTAKEAVATEAARVMRGTGAMAEQDIAHWRSLIQAANSPEQLHGVLATLGDDLVGSRVHSLEQQYRTVMGRDPPKFLSPESERALATLRSRAPKDASASPAAAAPNSQQPATVIQNGHTYTRQPDGSYQ